MSGRLADAADEHGDGFDDYFPVLAMAKYLILNHEKIFS